MQSSLLKWQNMKQTTIQGEFNSVSGMAAPACNETQQCCVDLVHLSIRMFNCCCGQNDSTYSGYIMLHIEPNKSHGKWKQGMTSQTQLANLQKSGFSSVELGTEVHTAGLQKILLWNSLLVCHSTHWLQWYMFIIFGSQAHVRTFQPS